MAILRLSVPRVALDQIPNFVAGHHGPVVLDCIDADTIICAAALKDEWTTNVGVWLEVSPEYPAQLCARDVATLSWIIELGDVVISAPTNAEEYAQVVRALLTDDEVTFTNEVASLSKAYNRPAPPRALRVWSSDGETLTSGGLRLARHSVTLGEIGELTAYV